MTNAVLAKGATLKLGSVTIGGLTSINFSGRSMGIVETTNLSSTVRTFIPTILDNGEATGTIQFDPDDTTGHVAMEALLTASPPAAATFTITTSDSTPSTYTFSGILTNLALSNGSVDDLLMGDFTIKVTGAITKA